MDLEGLSFVCNGLGFAGDNAYHLHEFCLENMKDLQRFLRRDNPQSRDVFKQVCKFNTVAVDLVPIIEQHHGDRSLLITAVKVLVFMTMPIDHASDNIYFQIECLWNLKASLTRNDTVAAIASLLEEPLERLDSGAFTEEDFNLVQLVLTLFRNLLAIQDMSLHQKTSGTSTQFFCLAERFLEILFSENVMELILVMTQHMSDSTGYLCQDNLLLLDIFHNVFLGQKPELIANPSQEVLKGDKYAASPLNSLRSIMEEEAVKRRTMRLEQRNHSLHAGGTFTCYNVDGSRMLLKGKPSVDPADSLIKSNKVQHGPLKKIMWDNESVSIYSGHILEQLHDFAEHFLSGGYNFLMHSIREDIQKDHHAMQDNEIMNFFQVARFFTAYQRYKYSHSKPHSGASVASPVGHHKDGKLFHGAVCGPLAETMNEAMFSFVLSKWHCAFDSLKQTSNYKLLSSSTSLMKEMIRILDLVLKLSTRESAGEAYTARVLLHKIFYDQTEEGIPLLLLNLMKSFDTHKQPRSDLADLLEMVHIMFRLMETLQSHGALRVKKKSRKRIKKKVHYNQVDQIEELTKEHQPSGIAVDVDINTASSMSSPSASARMLEKESCLNTILKGDNDLGLIEHEMPSSGAANVESWLREAGAQIDSSNHNQACKHESSEDDQRAALVEVDLDVSHMVSMFANCKVVQNLCWLLKFYESNRASTNYYIICMLQRITDDMKLTPMFFQLSILCIFYKILHDHRKAAHKQYKHIISFISKLVAELMNKLKSHPLLFAEILFWKTNRECRFIDSGFLLKEIGNLRSQTKHWRDDSIDIESGDSNKTGSHINIADALGEDDADVGALHKCDDPISRTAGSHNTSDQGEDEVGLPNCKASVSAEGMEPNSNLPSGKRTKAFTMEQDILIKELFERFKTERRCNHLIANALDSNKKYSAAQVARKLKQLGLRGPQQDETAVNKAYHMGSSNLVSTAKDRSDNETLSAHKKRLKKNARINLALEASMFSGDVTHSERGEVVYDASDDLPLGTMLRKKKKKVQQMVINEGYTTSTMQEGVIDDDSAPLSLPMSEMNKLAQSAETGKSEDPSMSTLNIDNVFEHNGWANANGLSVEENDDGASVQAEKSKRRGLLQKPSTELRGETEHILADEISNLEDDLDDTAPNVVSRKRHRLVYDFEDD